MTTQTLSDHSLADWRAVAARELADAGTRLSIDGDFRDSPAGSCFEPANPATRETIAAAVSAAVDAAVRAAGRAFESGVRSRMAPRSRVQSIFRFADRSRADMQCLAVLDMPDRDKPLSDTLGVDLSACVECRMSYRRMQSARLRMSA